MRTFLTIIVFIFALPPTLLGLGVVLSVSGASLFFYSIAALLAFNIGRKIYRACKAGRITNIV